jgi:hypothetical protein
MKVRKELFKYVGPEGPACCIDITDSPDDEHEVARNMLRIEINK